MNVARLKARPHIVPAPACHEGAILMTTTSRLTGYGLTAFVFLFLVSQVVFAKDAIRSFDRGAAQDVVAQNDNPGQ